MTKIAEWLLPWFEEARRLDEKDPLGAFRERFYFPEKIGVKAYFTGNSLGLSPKKAGEYLQEEMEIWKDYGVEGHFHGTRPWFSYHSLFPQHLAPLTGSHMHEVVAMGQLTANLHFLLASFYQPKGKRTRIICEANAFPSDSYALASQIRWHGLDPNTELIRVEPDPDTHVLDEEKLLKAIADTGENLALVMLGGVNYLSGQLLPMQKITEAAHAVGAFAGFDLAHAIGNVALALHDWDVDFAAWCSYKYLNSGPGSVAGIYIHEKHHQAGHPRLEGWWGNSSSTRFLMRPEIDPATTAEAWQLSNAPIFSMAPHLAALEIFTEAGLEALQEKMQGQIRFFNEMLREAQTHGLPVRSVTPEHARGCQSSLVIDKNGKAAFEALMSEGIVTDWREPNVIRVAPAPLYTQYQEICQLFDSLYRSLC